jgi:hypothetical protein
VNSDFAARLDHAATTSGRADAGHPTASTKDGGGGCRAAAGIGEGGGWSSSKNLRRYSASETTWPTYVPDWFIAPSLMRDNDPEDGQQTEGKHRPIEP